MLLNWQISGTDSFYSYICSEEILPDHLFELRMKGRESRTGRARLCFHENEDSRLHVMLIHHDDRTIVPVHRHQPFGEYIVHIEGTIDITILNERLEVTRKIVLSDNCINLPLWVAPNTWHTLSFRNASLFYEISEGPYGKKTTAYANPVKF